jgi:peptidyl-prolyl cis-trans isomerase A (cyclophilin A)|tara:strand:+ start:3554 stop:4138 length:585 start_codon:yes stop_codon:yes gene_type:complete
MSLLTLFKAATRPTILLAGFLWVLHGVAHAQDNPRVSLVTNKGAIEIELLPKFAPKHVANFLSLVEEEFYVGLVFHRVIPNFMIQAGGYDSDLNYKASERRIENESFNGLKNKRLTLAMARLNDPDSADTQFFINVRDNPHLDAQPGQPGYTVFGKVVDGLDVIETIELTDTHLRMGMVAVPEETIIIVATKLL